MSGALRHFLESEDAVNSSGGDRRARRGRPRLDCRRRGRACGRAASFGVSVFRCVDIRGARID
ncbi:hypothetical protein [Burkholderia sp. ABCPW 111]|uniref:hypothetical protein n=1 Tax=Burkholderia sp. ABCPW 111 TaxID=1820025 RepID=UPI000A74EBE7|nr:hypothetical protein [Burkholderia sp. ABCPW 111]